MDNEILKQLQRFLDAADQLHKQGRLQEAETVYQKIRQLLPNDVELLLKLAALQREMGNTGGAIKSCNKILALEPNNVKAYQIKSGAILPGDHYLTIIKNFHQHLKPAGYVEIGVETGQSLTLVHQDTRAVGIDPRLQLQLQFPLTPLTRTFELTSDDFFHQENLLEQLGTPHVDLGFIDGLHLFEQALKDFINLEPFMAPDGVVLMHDCFPIDRASSARKRETTFWSGDTWKIIPCLKHYRPDLKIFTIPATPSGLGVITRMDPASAVLKDNYEEIVKQYAGMEFQDLEKDKINILNVIPNHWPGIIKSLQKSTS